MYNVEKYIENCIESILGHWGQTPGTYMEFNLLVNACLNVVEKRMDIAGWMAYEWMFRTVVSVFSISLLLWNKFKDNSRALQNMKIWMDIS